MSNTVFPGAIDSITNPTGANTLNSPDHALQHGTENDAITALETKVGVDGSAVTTSFDYKLSGVTGTDKAASKTGSETLTNKTLGSGTALNIGSDATGDTYYRNSGGALTRLPIGTANQILAVSAGGLPNYVANPAANNGSTTVLGVFQEATQAQVDAGTTTGSTGGDLTIRPDTLRAKLFNSYVVDTGTANAYAIAPSPVIAAYAVGQVFVFKAINANTTTATLAVSGLTATTIKKYSAGALAVLAANDILANMLVAVVYDATNACFVMMNPPANSVTAIPVYKNGTTTKNLADASAAQTIAHGLGKAPLYVRLTCRLNSSTLNQTAWLAVAVYNGTTQSSTSNYNNGGNEVMDTTFTITAGVNGAWQTGVITFDGTNITITWTKTGSPAGTTQILWEAFA